MRRYENRESRFSNRVLMTYAACSLPETLALRAAGADSPAEILLYDEIGYWGVTATNFAAALSKAGDGPLTLRINSPGGDVFDGYAIYNMLRARTAPVSVIIDGLAASAASFIAMAGATVTMGEPSMLMIHNSWGMCIGDRNDMLDMAATQEKIDGQIAAIYATKSGKSVAVLATMMDDETWLTSTEAMAQKFCDTVISSAANAADFVPVARTDSSKACGEEGTRLDAKTAEDDAAKLVADRAIIQAAIDKDWSINARRRLRLAEAEAA